MTDSLLDIIFRGDIVPGQQIGDVKQRLAQLFKTSESRIDALFSGAAIPLKKNLDAATAQKYSAILTRAGAVVEVVAAGTVGVKSPPRKPAGKPAAKAATAGELRAQQSADAGAAPGWTLAPLGSNLLSVSERSATLGEDAVVVGTGNLSVRPMQGDLLDDNEKSKVASVVLGRVDFDIAELGADLVSEHERSVSVQVNPDTAGYALAPVGSDLGSINKKTSPPPPPDTSGISLVDQEEK